MARFGTLAHLDFDHSHLRRLGLGSKTLWVETPVCGAAAEVAATQFPRQVTTGLTVIAADTAFARIVGKVTEFGPLVQGANRVGA